MKFLLRCTPSYRARRTEFLARICSIRGLPSSDTNMLPTMEVKELNQPELDWSENEMKFNATNYKLKGSMVASRTCDRVLVPLRVRY